MSFLGWPPGNWMRGWRRSRRCFGPEVVVVELLIWVASVDPLGCRVVDPVRKPGKVKMSFLGWPPGNWMRGWRRSRRCFGPEVVVVELSMHYLLTSS